MSRKTHGFTLIELMVGVLLSMLIIVSLMSLYASSVQNTAQSNIGVKLDGDIALGLVQIDRISQNAGFGVPDGTSGYGSAVQVFNAGSPVGINQQGNMVAWQIAWSATNIRCQALESTPEGLVLRGGTEGYDCSGTVIPPASEDSSELLISIPAVDIEGTSGLGVASFEIELATDACLPFGVTATPVGAAPLPSMNGGALFLITRINAYAGSSGNADNTVQGRTCLFNTR